MVFEARQTSKIDRITEKAEIRIRSITDLIDNNKVYEKHKTQFLGGSKSINTNC